MAHPADGSHELSAGEQDIAMAVLSKYAAIIPRSTRKYIKGRTLFLGCMQSKIAPETFTAAGHEIATTLLGLLHRHFPEFLVSSIAINHNTMSTKHSDGRNAFKSAIVSLGSHTGGDLLIYPDGIDTKPDELIIHNRITVYDGQLAHANTPYDGDRWSLVFFVHRSESRLTTSTEHRHAMPLLEELGFKIPKPFEIIANPPVFSPGSHELFVGEADLLVDVLSKHTAIIPLSTVKKIQGHTLFLGCLQSMIAPETFTDAGREIATTLLSLLHQHFPKFPVSSIAIDYNTTSTWHRDGKRSVSQSAIMTLGPHTGGNLLVQSEGTKADQFIIHNRITFFGGGNMHCYTPYEGGARWNLVFFLHRSASQLDPSTMAALEELGFLIPDDLPLPKQYGSASIFDPVLLPIPDDGNGSDEDPGDDKHEKDPSDDDEGDNDEGDDDEGDDDEGDDDDGGDDADDGQWSFNKSWKYKIHRSEFPKMSDSRWESVVSHMDAATHDSFRWVCNNIEELDGARMEVLCQQLEVRSNPTPKEP